MLFSGVFPSCDFPRLRIFRDSEYLRLSHGGARQPEVLGSATRLGSRNRL